jgi:hypothetical protein
LTQAPRRTTQVLRRFSLGARKPRRDGLHLQYGIGGKCPESRDRARYAME